MTQKAITDALDEEVLQRSNKDTQLMGDIDRLQARGHEYYA